MGIAIFLWSRHSHGVPGALHLKPVPHPLLHSLSRWLMAAMALAAAAALWRMHRSAAIFFGARFGLALLWFLVALPYLMAQHWPSVRVGSPFALQMIVVRWGSYLLSIGILTFDAALAWYAYDVTAKRDVPPALDPEFTTS
jgi:hypothetical protein